MGINNPGYSLNVLSKTAGAQSVGHPEGSVGVALGQRAVAFYTIESLAAADPTIVGSEVILALPGRTGGFTWNAADVSAEVSADALQGVYVATEDDLTGASGAWVRVVEGFVTPGMFGGTGVGDDSTAINAAYASGYRVLLDKDYSFTAITLPVDADSSGPGRLIGLNAAGIAPSYAVLSAAATSADRLALLQAYTPNTITLTGAGICSGQLTVLNALVLGNNKLTIKGELTLSGCSSYQAGLVSLWSGRIDADGLISTDSMADGLMAQRGGVISADSAIVMHPVSRGLHIQFGGTIFFNDGYCTDTAAGNDALFVNNGGSIAAQRAFILNNGRVGATVIYGGSINLEDAQIDGNSGAGIVSESNGAIYAEGATITNNNKGLSVSYGGFIQARNSTITGNTGLAVDGLTGGIVNVAGATIDNTNNAGGTQIRLKAFGYCFAEAPGTVASGKDALTAEQYSPEYGVVGNGTALIFDGDGVDYAQYPNDKTAYSINRHLISRRETETLSAGSITAKSSYILVQSEDGLTDDLDTIVRDPDAPVDMLILAAADNVTINVKHNTGNIRTYDGASDIVLDSKARSTMLIWNRELNIWSQPKFS